MRPIGLPILALCSVLPLSLPRSGEAASLTTDKPPAAQIFAPGEISGPASDGAPTFSPDGNSLFFTRSAALWTVIVESHRVNEHWSKPVIAPFSGEWPDSSPALAPDGSYLVFQSTRPRNPDAPVDKKLNPRVSNLWRVDRAGAGWSKPVRLPDTVNLSGAGIWKPSLAADGTIFFTVIDDAGKKRLYAAQRKGGDYAAAEPLPFSDGSTSDVDPEIAPDRSFLVFSSAGRVAGDTKDHLFIVSRQGSGWGTVAALRYAGDYENGGSTDDEPRLGPDRRTLYFSSDRSLPVHFPRTRSAAQQDLDRLDQWDNGNGNVWSLQLSN